MEEEKEKEKKENLITNNFNDVYKAINTNNTHWKATTKIYADQQYVLMVMGKATKELSSTTIEGATFNNKLKFIGSFSYSGLNKSKLLKCLRKPKTITTKEWVQYKMDIGRKWESIFSYIKLE